MTAPDSAGDDVTAARAVTLQVDSVEEPTSEELSLVKFGMELRKSTFTTLNTSLGHLVTLSATLLGGSTVFLDASIVGEVHRLIVLPALFAALVCSFCGLVPYNRTLRLGDTNQIKDFLEGAYEWKTTFISLTAIALGIAFATAIHGVACL